MAPSEKVAALRALRVPGLPRFRLADAADASAKDVYFIRHGEAAHNVAPRPWGEELVDAPLTDVGRQQAAGLVPQAAGVTLDVVIVSPLVRAIETATIGLAAHLERGVPFVVEELCREQRGPNLPDKRRPKDALAAAHPALDFSAMPDGEDTLFMTERPSKVECVRPRGVDRPTHPSRLPPARAAPGQAQGRPPASASRLCLPPPAPSLLTLPPRPPAAANRQMCSGWPAHTDPCSPPWRLPHPWCCSRRREELPLISTRADAFLQWLHARPEQRIAVVTHSSFLAALLNAALDSRAQPEVGEWFGNAEMRHVRLARLCQ